MLWNKVKDTIEVNFQVPYQPTTKRGMLKFLHQYMTQSASFHPSCYLQRSCTHVQRSMRPEAVLGPKTTRRPYETMDKMDKDLPHQQIEVPRSIPMYNEKIGSLTLHVFVDASSKGVCAAVYAVVDQLKGKSQGLLISKSIKEEPYNSTIRTDCCPHVYKSSIQCKNSLA